jgi:hypothetical protein
MTDRARPREAQPDPSRAIRPSDRSRRRPLRARRRFQQRRATIAGRFGQSKVTGRCARQIDGDGSGHRYAGTLVAITCRMRVVPVLGFAIRRMPECVAGSGLDPVHTLRMQRATRIHVSTRLGWRTGRSVHVSMRLRGRAIQRAGDVHRAGDLPEVHRQQHKENERAHRVRIPVWSERYKVVPRFRVAIDSHWQRTEADAASARHPRTAPVGLLTFNAAVRSAPRSPGIAQSARPSRPA